MLRISLLHPKHSINVCSMKKATSLYSFPMHNPTIIITANVCVSMKSLKAPSYKLTHICVIISLSSSLTPVHQEALCLLPIF